MTTATMDRDQAGRTREALKRAGNPFRNYFARNPDDDVCARYHVPELFTAERDLLHAIIDLYRYDPLTHSEVVPILGNKGAGKTHLLHSIKHGQTGHFQLLVTPGVYQKESDFLEYLLFQLLDTLLGGGKQKGVRPLEYVAERLVRQHLGAAIRALSPEDKVELFPPPGIGKWARRLGLGSSQAAERGDWLAEHLSAGGTLGRAPLPLSQALSDAGLPPEKALELLVAHAQKTESRATAGLMRQQIIAGFARAALLGDETELANFLTYGFAELDFHVRPTRQDLVLALLKVMMDLFRSLKIPVVVAFDQLEDLLLARRSDDAHKIAEAFFAGIVQVMHQIDGLCFLIFAERGLWNRFVPSLDGYIQDRLNNPVHVPKLGTVKALRLEAPPAPLVRAVVEARLRPVLAETPDSHALSDIYPFTDDHVARIAKSEPTLRDMLQQFRHLFDHVVYEAADDTPVEVPTASFRGPERAASVDNATVTPPPVTVRPPEIAPRAEDDGPVMANELAITEIPTRPEQRISEATFAGAGSFPDVMTPTDKQNRIDALLGKDVEVANPPGVSIKSVTIVETAADPAPGLAAPENPTAPEVPSLAAFPGVADIAHDALRGTESAARGEEPEPAAPVSGPTRDLPAAALVSEPARGAVPSASQLADLWDHEFRTARRKLEPDGALTGATRELQSALGLFLTTCHEHGVKVGAWRLQHVVPEWPFGEHPTYGAVSLAHWACQDGQPWRVAVGLFLARGAGKPKDLEIKLSAMNSQPQVVDHLILLRPEDDMALSGKSKTLWQEAERRGQHARLEAVSLDGYAWLESFPRWLAAVRESLPEGVPMPNLADAIQEKAEKLLEQVCMPVTA